MFFLYSRHRSHLRVCGPQALGTCCFLCWECSYPTTSYGKSFLSQWIWGSPLLATTSSAGFPPAVTLRLITNLFPQTSVSEVLTSLFMYSPRFPTAGSAIRAVLSLLCSLCHLEAFSPTGVAGLQHESVCFLTVQLQYPHCLKGGEGLHSQHSQLHLVTWLLRGKIGEVQ